MAGERNLLQSDCRRKESPGSVAFSQLAIDHLKKEGGCRVDKAGLNAAWDSDALPAEVKHTHNSFHYIFKKKGTSGRRGRCARAARAGGEGGARAARGLCWGGVRRSQQIM
jgi:hypothetical protein